MDRFKEIIMNIISAIIITSDDSEADKAKKIAWYAFFGTIIIIIVVSWIIFVSATFSENLVKVPNIEGDNIYTALKKISDKRLVAVASPKYTDDYSAGVVFMQSPWQGSIVKKGRMINFSVSLGSKDNALPDFRGYTLFELSDYIDTLYINSKIPFAIEPVSYEFSNTVEKGRIIRQTPREGTPISQVKNIKFIVSNGIEDKSEDIVKNYIGKKFNDVMKELSNVGVLYSFRLNIANNVKDNYIITAQNVNEGMMFRDLIEEDKMIILDVNISKFLNNNVIEGFYMLSLDKKSISYNVEVRLSNNSETEVSTVLNLETRGGCEVPVPYYNKTESKLIVLINNEKDREISLKDIE